MKHVTLPVAPWEIPDHVEPEVVEETPIPIEAPPEKPERSSVSLLIDRTFMGQLNTSDLHYMGKAILQLCDENHEMRERIRAMEMVVQKLVENEAGTTK